VSLAVGAHAASLYWNYRIPDETVVAIRSDRKNTGMSYSKLGAKYSIGMMTAWKICNGKSRKEVKSG